jgi:hypothetical protein
MITRRLRRHICARSGLEDRLVDAIVCAWRECAADTFVAVEHVGDRSSIRFGLVACDCGDGTCSLCASVRFSSREEMDAWKWVERERGGGNVDRVM